MAGNDRLQEYRLGAGDVLDGLAGHGIGQEAYMRMEHFIATPISLSALKPPMGSVAGAGRRRPGAASAGRCRRLRTE